MKQCFNSCFKLRIPSSSTQTSNSKKLQKGFSTAEGQSNLVSVFLICRQHDLKWEIHLCYTSSIINSFRQPQGLEEELSRHNFLVVRCWGATLDIAAEITTGRSKNDSLSNSGFTMLFSRVRLLVILTTLHKGDICSCKQVNFCGRSFQ